jgi:hypothetical protein
VFLIARLKKLNKIRPRPQARRARCPKINQHSYPQATGCGKNCLSDNRVGADSENFSARELTIELIGVSS